MKTNFDLSNVVLFLLLVHGRSPWSWSGSLLCVSSGFASTQIGEKMFRVSFGLTGVTLNDSPGNGLKSRPQYRGFKLRSHQFVAQ